jgi:hypothetical protein
MIPILLANYNKEPFVRTQFIVIETQFSGPYLRNASNGGGKRKIKYQNCH